MISDELDNQRPSVTEVIEGEEISLKCSAQGNSPAAIIRWRLNDQLQPDWPDGTDTSTVTYVPEWSHHGNIIKCTAFVPADTVGVNSSITLDVKGMY